MSQPAAARRSRTSDRWVAALWLLGLLYFLPHLWWPVSRYDEGILLAGAQRVLAGELPYRDFWTLYGPAQFGVLAVLFGLGSESLAVSRSWELAVRAALPALAFLVASRIAGRGSGLAVWVLLAAWLWQFPPTNYPVFPALAGIVAGTLLLASRRWALAGALTVAAGFFRHDLGVFALVAHVAALAATAREGLPRYVIGAGAVGLPAALLVLLLVPWPALVDALYVFPTAVYPSVRALPHPLSRQEVALSLGPVAVAFHLTPPFARALVATVPVLAAGSALAAWRVWRALAPACRPMVLALALMVPLFLQPAWVRSDLAHLAPVALPVVILLAAGASTLPAAARGRLVVAVVLLGGAVGVAAAMAGSPRAFLLRPCDSGGLPEELRRRSGWACIAGDQAAALASVRAAVPEGERIFVAAAEHDRVLAGDLSFYFLAGRLPATRYHELHPGLTTTRRVQEAMVEDLDRARVRMVVRVDGGFWEEPNASRISSGVRLLDRYLDENFSPVSRVGRYAVLVRRGPAPSGE